MTLQEREARACAIIDSMAQELRAVSYIYTIIQNWA